MSEALLAIGALAWIYPPCGETCGETLERPAYVIMMVALGSMAFGLGAAPWIGSESSGSAGAVAQRSDGRRQKLSDSVALIGIPPLILGVLLFVVGGTIFGGNVLTGRSPAGLPASALNNATSVLQSGGVLALSGLLVVLAGFLMDWSRRSKEAQGTTSLVLQASRGSMWPIISAMVREEHGPVRAPSNDSSTGLTAPPPSSPMKERLSRSVNQERMTARTSLDLGWVLAAILTVALGIDLAWMLQRVV